MDKTDKNHDRMAWWHEAKLGMFVHWGCYSTLTRGEQVILRDLMPLDEYYKIADAFHPADDWADTIADQAVRMGAKYVVLTTRHHDGYCLFDTKTDDFNAVKTGPRRDLVAEYVTAMRKRGLRVGFYYSVVNWRWRGFWDPETYADELPLIAQQVHDQVTELMTHYGKVDILWYDVSAVPGANTPGASGYHGKKVDQTSAEFYRSEKLNARVRDLQPDIIINNRSGTPEDFGTPEQHVTAEKDDRAWEACMTKNFAPNWACVNQAVTDKSAGQILFHMMDAARKGGNFLFNIGPDAKGYVCDRDREALDTIGKWLARNGEAFFGTRTDPVTGHERQGACYHYGIFTNKGTTSYLTLFFYPRDYLIVSKVGGGLKCASILSTGQELTIERLRNQRYKISGLPAEMPDDPATVVKMEFETTPCLIQFSGAEWLDGDYE
ncbi:MAG: alpha-L-fucosidase [Lentisphaeria bacterium]|nr:alpha-L-fucosidase [Lentisphaeria bacterium]